MALDIERTRLSRRDFLRAASAGALGLALLPEPAEAEKQAHSYAPFRMGIQSYSLRAFDAEDALAKTQALGLKFWEAYPNHLPLTDNPQKIADYKALLKKYGVKLAAYGVIDFRNDETDARKKFDFAKAMGIAMLSAYPTYDSFDLLNRLVKEYKINLGIHNHGPGDDRYDLIQKAAAKLEGCDTRFGMCIDTGHYLRSQEDPVEAARLFGKRVHGIHLKDVKAGPNREMTFTELGKGDLRATELLRVLRKNGFKGVLSLEYEEHENAPIPYIEECLAATRAAIKAM